MAVVAVWQCDRDGSMFEDKKLADAHDKMLELAEAIMHLIETQVPGVNEEDAEAIGLLLAKNRDNLLKACKGKPEVLLELSAGAATTAPAADDARVVDAGTQAGKPSLKKAV